MWRSSVLLPDPLPPMMTKTSPRRTVKSISRITTKLPKAIVRLRTVMQAGRSATFVSVPAVGSPIASETQNVEHQRERAAGDHDENDPGHHRRGRRVAHRRRVVAALKAAQASRDRDNHSVNGTLEHASEHVAERD